MDNDINQNEIRRNNLTQLGRKELTPDACDNLHKKLNDELFKGLENMVSTGKISLSNAIEETPNLIYLVNERASKNIDCKTR